MVTLDEITIDGQTYFVPGVKRAVPEPHECICLLVKEQAKLPSLEDLELATKGQMPEGFLEMVTIKDKCHQIVDNPDQPFCDDCENQGHPELHRESALKIEEANRA